MMTHKNMLLEKSGTRNSKQCVATRDEVQELGKSDPFWLKTEQWEPLVVVEEMWT